MSDLFDSIFDFDQTGLSTFETPTSSGVEMFNPQPEGGKKYIVTLRLIMNLKAPKDSIVSKRTHWLKDAQGVFSIDSPSTFGGFCPVSKAYFTLKKSAIPAQKTLSKELTIKKQYVAYVQIIDDSTKPENNGKILPWRMPVEIHNKVTSWMNPSDEELAAKKKPRALLNLLSSYNLIVTVFNKTDAENGGTYRGYEVELSETLEPLTIEGKTYGPEATNEDKKLLVEKLTELQTVDLVEKFGYIEADAQLKARVKALLGGKFGQDVNGYWQDVQAAAPQAVENGAPSIVDTASAPSQPAQVMTETTTVSSETKAEEVIQPAQGSDDELDDILANIQ